MPKKWILIALLNLLIAMSIGALLRFAYIQEVSWLVFKNFLHAHSHVAMLGWVYLALFAFLVASFLPKKQNLRKYNILFWLTQGSVLGMLITFPIMGYAGWSIGFSTLHTLLSYVFVFYFLKDLKKYRKENNLSAQQADNTNTFSIRLVKAGLFFLVFSSFGLWAMGPIMAFDLQGGALYYSTIQFYLHFQFNGWFIFTILALFFKIIENNNITFSKTLAKQFFSLLLISCYLTYALAVTWSKPIPVLFIINSSGVLLQLLALFFFIKIIQNIRPHLQQHLEKTVVMLFTLAGFAFALKIIIQSAVVIPAIGIIGYTIRNFVMGFLHLMLIGMVTLFLFGYAQHIRFLQFHQNFSKIGIRVFIVGFFLSELILFLQGTMFWGAMGFMPYYYELLFVVSAMIPSGLLLIIGGQFAWSSIGFQPTFDLSISRKKKKSS